jgi:hypothetical protein
MKIERWARHVVCMREKRGAYLTLVRKPDRKGKV